MAFRARRDRAAGAAHRARRRRHAGATLPRNRGRSHDIPRRAANLARFCVKYLPRLPRTRRAALAGHHQDKPRALDLRPRQEFPQGNESLLPAHAMQVDRGVGRGTAARELLAKPPLKRRERGRSLSLDRRRRRRAGSFGRIATGLARLKLRVISRPRKRRRTAPRPARDAPRHVKPELDLLRAQQPEPGRPGEGKFSFTGPAPLRRAEEQRRRPRAEYRLPARPRHPPSRRKYRRGRDL